MTKQRPFIAVRVSDHLSRPLAKAKVTLRPTERGQGRAVSLKLDRFWEVYAADKVRPGRYLLRAEAPELEAQERAVEVGPAGLEETFLLGRPGMPFYFRGRAQVPFEPFDDLIGVSLRPVRRGEEDGPREMLDLARQLGLREEQAPEEALRDHVRLFRLPSPHHDDRGRQALRRLADHPRVRRAGAVVRLDGRSVSFLTGELIVRFGAHAGPRQVASTARRLGLEVVRPIPYAGNAFLLRGVEPGGYELLRACAALAGSVDVEYAEPNLVTTAVPDFTPGDPLYDQQPHHAVIGSEGAWDVTLGDSDRIVAVVDAGCDIDHPDFVNDPGAGWTKVYQPFDFAALDADPLADTHGTKSSGIATANLDNATGVAGIAGGCRLMPLRWPAGGTDLDYSDMYIWCAGFDPGSGEAGFPAPISPGADVISNSFGLSQAALSGLMKDTLDFLTTYGRGGKGCVVVFSVGNDNLDFTTYRQWAAYEKTIAVASSRISPPDPAEVKVSTSNFGSKVDVCAPGGGSGGAETRTMSTDNVGGGADYATFGQTSCACPQVSGTAALMLSANPALTWVEVRQILRDTAVKIDFANADPLGQWVDTDGDGVNDYSQWYGYGRINAQAAVEAADADPANRDIVVRDNLADAGTVPAGGAFWNSPDLWVRNVSPAMDGAAALPASYGAAPPHEPPIFGQDNWIYVRVRNQGAAPSLPFYVRTYITHFAGFEFVYPNDYIPTNNPGDPVPSPLTTGTYLIGEVRVDSLAADADATVNLVWPQALVPPETVEMNGMDVHWHPCVLVEVSPHDGPAASGVHVWDDNNLAQKNLTIVYPDDDGFFASGAVLGNRFDRSTHAALVVDRRAVPADVRLFVELLDPEAMDRLRRTLRGGRDEESCCRLTLLEETRVEIACEEGEGRVLTLPKGTELAAAVDRQAGGAVGLTLGRFRGREVLWLNGPGEALIPIAKEPGGLVPVLFGGVASRRPPKEGFQIHLAHRDASGRVIGGVSIEIRER